MDHIKNLLLQTGWSCDDLIEKLKEFKTCSTEENSSKCDADFVQNINTNKNNLIQNVTDVNRNCHLLNKSDHTYTCTNVKHNIIVNNNDEMTRLNIETEQMDNLTKAVATSDQPNQLMNNLPPSTIQQDDNKMFLCKKIDRTVKTFLSSFPYKNIKRPISCKTNFISRLKRSYKRRLSHKNNKHKSLIPKYKFDVKNEGLRNQIMLQLELLRSRKVTSFSTAITHQSSNPVPVVCKKRYSGEKFNSMTNDDSRFILCDDNTKTDNQNNLENKTPFEQTSSFGTNELESNNFTHNLQNPLETIQTKEIVVSSNELCNDIVDNYSIKPTKTTDITKIKGWKNKKFLSVEQPGNNILKINKPSISEAISFSNHDENLDLTSQTLDVGSKSDNKSAFASSNLDGFLHDSSNLHISFQIPTLESANTIENPSKSITPPLLPEKQNSFSINETKYAIHDTQNLLKIHKIDNLYRPRTVGQKRRIWGLKRDTKVKKNLEENPLKPRTLAEKRRLLDQNGENSAPKTKVKKHDDDTKYNYSYVLYRGRKLKVPTRLENGIITYIKACYGKKDYIYLPKRIQNKSKPSIFNNNCVVKSEIVKYRPGPLSKKHTLQQENENWKTVVKHLPQIYLEVKPQVNKPIQPGLLHLLPDYDFELTNERIEFALSVVRDKSKNNEIKSFTFPVNYANSQEIAMFRKKTINNYMKDASLENDSEVHYTIKTMIDNMLGYIETKEISEEILKEDINTKIRDSEVFMDKQPTLKRKKKKKQSKTNYELKRLNVKVIEVNLEEKEEDGNCDKDYCRLGCVCKSLATTSSLVSNHCGIPDCMFTCTCNYNKKSKGNLKVTLPIGTDMLSEGAVNRLEVEAKRNLAKVEKEFTQTVIQANNQTIVVGGCTNRQRRASKLPKKYNDFIDDPDLLLNDQLDEYEVEGKIECNTKQIEWKPCVVNITNLKLDQVIPYCLVHQLHDCHCKFKGEFKSSKTVYKKRVVSKETPVQVEFLENQDKVKIINKNSTSARTKGISTDYYLIRNRTNQFVNTRNKILDRKYRKYLDSLPPFEEQLDNEQRNQEVVQDQCLENNKAETNKKIENSIGKKSRRKQQLTFRQDNVSNTHVLHKITKPKKTCLDNAMQRRKTKMFTKNLMQELNKKVKNMTTLDSQSEILVKEFHPSGNNSDVNGTTLKSYVDTNINKDLDDPLPKFGDLLEVDSTSPYRGLVIPSTEIRNKFLEILGKSTDCQAKFGMMFWNNLALKFETRQLHVWYSSYFKYPRIFVTDSNITPQHFINIKKFEAVEDKSSIEIDFIRWLINKTVPGNKLGADVLVIMQVMNTYCEVCGICEKNSLPSQNMDNFSLIPSIITEKSIKKKSENLKSNATEGKSTYSVPIKIEYSKDTFTEQTLVDETVDEEHDSFKFITVQLPHINRASLWRMIALNSDFSMLCFERNKYAIKYSDLLRIAVMAKTMNKTVSIKSEDLVESYKHINFAIYASPNCDDKIFIGPYYQAEHDITTYRYVNKQLIKTELFNQMKGLSPDSIGVWLKQVQNNSPSKICLQTIDLTENDSDNDETMLDVNIKENIQCSPSSSRSLLKVRSDVVNPSSEDLNSGIVDPLLIRENDIFNVPGTDPLQIDEVSSNTMMEIEKVEKIKDLFFTRDDIDVLEMSVDDYEIEHSIYNRNVLREIGPNINFEKNLYFMTNVPTMGYILGHEVIDGILVRWPSRKFGKLLPDIKDVIPWLERELHELFITIPNFQIKVTYTNNILPIVNKPFDLKYLQGYYVASRLGVVSLLNITPQTLFRLKTTKKEILELAKARAKKVICDACYCIAVNLYPLEIPNINNCSEILILMCDEIKREKQLRRDLNIKRRLLKLRRDALLNKFTSTANELPPSVDSKFRAAIMNILDRHKIPKQNDESLGNVECINLDSDEETLNISTHLEKNVTEIERAKKLSPQNILKPQDTIVESNITSAIKPKPCVSILKCKQPIISSPYTGEKLQIIPVKKINQNIYTLITNSKKQDTVTESPKVSLKKPKYVIKTLSDKFVTLNGKIRRIAPKPLGNESQIKANLSSYKSVSILSNKAVSKATTSNCVIVPAQNQFVRLGFNEDTSKVVSIQPYKLGDTPIEAFTGKVLSVNSSDQSSKSVVKKS